MGTKYNNGNTIHAIFRMVDQKAAIRELVPSLKWSDKGEAKGRCPLCKSKNSFSVDRDNMLHCDKCDVPPTVFHLYAALNNISPDDALDFYQTHTKVHKTTTSEVPVLTELSMVEPQKISWLWHRYIPLGKLCLLDGDPELGKSLISIDLASRITSNQKMPDGSKGVSGGVVLLSVEDGLADTIVPRVIAAGGDRTKICCIEGVKDAAGGVRLPTVEDLNHIEAACRKYRARLLIIDPLMGFLNGKTDSHRDQDIRRCLTPLAKLVDKLGVACLVIRHLNKSGGTQSIYRGGGSIGIIGIARAGLLVAKDPKNPGKRILAGIKSNLGPKPLSLSYEVVAKREKQGDKDGIPKIIWGDVSDCTADSLLTPEVERKESAIDAAKDFLKNELKDGPKNALDIIQMSKDLGLGFCEKTLAKAKSELGITSKKSGGIGKGWLWGLPRVG